MPRITKVYTRTGDDGSTALGSGQRIQKTHPRIVAYGTVDEVNAHVGAALAVRPASDLVEPLRQIQNDLFHLGASLCVREEDKQRYPMPEVEQQHVQWLEELMDRFSAKLPALENFVLPGGTPTAAHLHVARTVCRRGERSVLELAEDEPIGAHVVVYLNRLSDALFVLARYDNHAAGVPEPTWNSRA